MAKGTGLTEAELERAARSYCELMGVDPDAPIGGSHPEHPTLAIMQPAWRWQIGRVRDFVAISQAVAEARRAALAERGGAE